MAKANAINSSIKGLTYPTADGTVDQVIKTDGAGTLSFGTVSGAGDVGGLYGLNVETLAASKTLTVDTDEIYQYLDPNGVNRTVTLDTASATIGDRFVIRNMGSFNANIYLQVKQSTSILDNIYSSAIKEFIFDGTNWEAISTGTSGKSVATGIGYNVAIGSRAKGIDAGTAVGYQSIAGSYAVAVGHQSDGDIRGTALGGFSDGSNYGVAVGQSTIGSGYGVAIGVGANTNAQNFAVAKGYKSKCERYNEEVKSSDGVTVTKYSYSTLAWHAQTTTATQTEILLGGTAAKRLDVLASSGFSFAIQIVALKNNYTDGKTWRIEGMIARDAANVTALIGSVTKTVLAESAGATGWDVSIEADDTNEALIIKVTGQAATTIRWIARGELAEVRF